MSVRAAAPGFAPACFLLPVEHTAHPFNHICSSEVRQEENVALRG